MSEKTTQQKFLLIDKLDGYEIQKRVDSILKKGWLIKIVTNPETVTNRLGDTCFTYMIVFERTKDISSMDERFIRMRNLLSTPINDLDFPERLRNVFKSLSIKTLGDLVSNDLVFYKLQRNLGAKSLQNIQDVVDDLGLILGMNVEKYFLDEL